LRLTVLVAVAVAFALSAAFVPNGATRAADGPISFTAAQAATGAKAYAQNCASCHGANLMGVTAPALAGKSSGIAQQPLSEVYQYVSQQMPMTAPGSLSKTQYVNIVAYLLQKNGHKPGPKPLTQSVVTTATATIQSKP
jgi:mono/diheme cytochrome c family protein